MISLLSFSNNDLIPEKFYCSEQCRQKTDKLRVYSLTLLQEGLRNLANKRAVREGDGPLMFAYWRNDVLDFWRRSNTKYIQHAHNMLVGEF
jgi:uncharacterized protein YhfF